VVDGVGWVGVRLGGGVGGIEYIHMDIVDIYST
jgi:hypothetical protein